MAKVYISYSDVLVTDWFTKAMKELVSRFDVSREHEALQYRPLQCDTQARIYEEDIACIEESNLCVFICSEQSFYVGACMMYALDHKKTTLFLVPIRLKGKKVESQITRLMEGHPGCASVMDHYDDSANDLGVEQILTHMHRAIQMLKISGFAGRGPLAQRVRS